MGRIRGLTVPGEMLSGPFRTDSVPWGDGTGCSFTIAAEEDGKVRIQNL